MLLHSKTIVVQYRSVEVNDHDFFYTFFQRGFIKGAFDTLVSLATRFLILL